MPVLMYHAVSDDLWGYWDLFVSPQTMEEELLYLQEFHSVEHFIQELHEYIEWYNNKRIKLKLNGLSPVEFRHEAA